MIFCQDLIERHPQLWHDATHHPFLDACQSGTIGLEQFDTWLVQDYQFVVEFTRFLANVLTGAPVEHFDVLLGGLVAIKDELNWFREKARERGLTLQTDKHPTGEAYTQYLASWEVKPYPVRATALWAIELAYNQGWQLPGKMAAPYDEFADRWGNPEFTEYVKHLERQADESLQAASEPVQQQAEAVFREVARLEREFWQMAFASPSENFA
ncbi:Tthiaminease II like protein involved in salvage of thiamine pyrimidine moiety [Geitlerinema sp. FC II]|nr:Tthiaminease II like protein involved in salvage of thiamine pyrimidine moiety [Geitlerinema sp. FC II]